MIPFRPRSSGGPRKPQSEKAGKEERADRLRRSTESVLSLPTLPESVSRLLGMVDDPDTSARAVAQAISSDQVLTARVLKLANSSYYGFQQKVGTVSLALVVLGFQAVKDLALTTSVMRSFGKDPTGPRFDMHAFWEHALAVGVASRYLSRVLHVGAVGEAFTAGILHDIGQVVLHEYHPEDFQRTLRLAREENRLPHEAEMEVHGAGHPQVGSWLCKRWNLPDSICQAVALHHGPFPGDDETGLSAVVALGDHLARAIRPGSEGQSRHLDEQVLRRISSLGTTVDVSDIPALLDAVRGEIVRTGDQLEAYR